MSNYFWGETQIIYKMQVWYILVTPDTPVYSTGSLMGLGRVQNSFKAQLSKLKQKLQSSGERYLGCFFGKDAGCYTCDIGVSRLTNQTYTTALRGTITTSFQVQSAPASVRTLINRIFKSPTINLGQPHSLGAFVLCCAFLMREGVLNRTSMPQLSAYYFRCLVRQSPSSANRAPRTVVLDLHVTCIWCVHAKQANLHLYKS